jgi:hypothetical protein
MPACARASGVSALSAVAWSVSTVPSTYAMTKKGAPSISGPGWRPIRSGTGTVVGRSAARMRYSRSTSWAEACRPANGGRRSTHRRSSPSRTR